MAVFRVEKTQNYTVMSNHHLKEKEMSLKAKGLLSLMLSLPSEWDYSIKGLEALSKDGKDSVMNTLNELEKFHYLKRTRCFDVNGKFAGYDYDIYEIPYSEKPNTENTNTEKPYSEKPNTEKPTQLNTKKLNKEELSTKKSNTKQKNNAKVYPKKSESFDEILNSLNNKDLEDAFKEFINMRKEIKKPLTPYALRLAIKELFRLSKDSEEMVAIVNQSIANSWQGLFPLKKINNNNTYNNTYQNTQKSSNQFLDLLNEGGF